MATNANLISRRNILLGLGGTAAVGAVAVQSGGAGSIAQMLAPSGWSRGGDLPAAGYAEWSANIGTKFTANTGQVLELAEVQRFPQKGRRPASVRDRAFVARFDVKSGEALPEGLYRVAQAGGRTFDMFLSGADKPLRMLAVFG